MQGMSRRDVVGRALALAAALGVRPAGAATKPPPGRAAAAPAMLLAREAAAGQSPVGYRVSEKLDGVRAQWDGRVLRFRGGGLVPAPGWFTAGLPAVVAQARDSRTVPYLARCQGWWRGHVRYRRNRR